MNSVKELSMEAAMFKFAFEQYTTRPHLVEPYKALDEDDLLALVKGVGFDGAHQVNKIPVELGWVHPTSHGWVWKSEWIEELKRKGHLAYFYVLVKTTNQNVAHQRAQSR